MRTASQCVTDDDKSSITRAVAEAESRTSAEIVPVVATASGRYDRPEDIVGLWSGAALAAATWLGFSGSQPSDWGVSASDFELPAILLALVAGFIIGAVVGSRVGWLRALFTPAKQMRDEVDQRARSVFFDGRVHHTAGATGVLVYVSLFERMAAVIADKQVLEKLGQDSLDELCAELTGKLKTGGLGDAISSTIKMAGDKLSPELPRESDDVNELSDVVICLD